MIGSGLSVFVTDRSADNADTVVVAVPVSLPMFGSGVEDAAVALFVMTVPSVTDGSTATTSVKTLLPTLMPAMEQLTAPVAPTAGVVHNQPPGAESDTNVVPTGSVS